MKRAGFTMIELIFVIVIIGILATVALPKLVGVQEQAGEGIVKGFVGTLNRTIGPAKWSKSLMDGNDGNVTTYDINLTDTDFPQDLVDGGVTGIDLSLCASSTGTDAAKIADGKEFSILCRDGNQTTAPRFWYRAKASNKTTLPSNSNDLKIQ